MEHERDDDCLSDETIVAYLGGGLYEEARQSLEGHVVRCGTCRELVANAAFGALIKTGSSLSGESRSDEEWVTEPGQFPRLGDVIADKYLVEGYLGSGSMGWVLAARHRDLGHSVAIKVLRPTGAEAARRFLAEAQTCARLSHPNITRVFDIGQLKGGAPYMVMEHLVGKDLAEIVAQGPVAIRDAVRWVIQACNGLAEAHAAGIVHRDLKPANLFLASTSGAEPAVKVLDFGISKISKTAANESADGATATGVAVGSPVYMSPEQIRGGRDVDRRSDIWSLGVILYQLTTGRPPFRGPGLPALSVAIAVESPPRPSVVRREVPRELERIILRCLSKLPRGRYPTVSELVADLTAFNSRDVSIGAKRRFWIGWILVLTAGLGAATAAVVIVRVRDEALSGAHARVVGEAPASESGSLERGEPAKVVPASSSAPSAPSTTTPSTAILSGTSLPGGAGTSRISSAAISPPRRARKSALPAGGVDPHKSRARPSEASPTASPSVAAQNPSSTAVGPLDMPD